MSYYHVIARITTGQGEDYTSGRYNVTFTPGMTTASLSISINDDNVFEETETFRLVIYDSASLHNDVTLGSPRSAVKAIQDNDSK